MNARMAAVIGAMAGVIAVVVIGVSLGWLSGLSTSPLLSVAMPVLLTLIASALAAVRLIRKPAADAPTAISVYTIAVFAVGLAGGATLGTAARLGDWFAPDPARAIE